ncbi:PilZ domain-containing protein [Halodesulfovibrio marinisediminis]|uniref:PilZ domain-containing protein n=1 Tax=Halodesulfovibrio marinisediminis DSM 17456 TaxID=1121457 RepID=A0A1N6EZY4_9BACT|nr:PilZ domain-containing protein [Halodesulfovibrio marinisediminis]SIN88543.1 PilZ domain-containing protein [Halodesulfovibrio marinisediminis DSM 17456]
MPQEAHHQERRAIPRYSYPFTASIAEFVFPMSCQPAFKAECIDITSKGAMLEVGSIIPKGSVQQVCIDLPGFEKKLQNSTLFTNELPYQVRVITRVIWTNVKNDTSVIGVEFLNMNKSAEQALARYLKEKRT